MKKIVLLLISILFTELVYSQTQLWGITSKGGQYSGGTIFKTDSSGNNQIIENDFFEIEGGNAASYLTQASDGFLYGCSAYGKNGFGILFQYNPATDSFINKVDFSTMLLAYPVGPLLQATDGNLYGMTYKGGVNNFGTIFQYNPVTNILSKKFDFDSITSGCNPHEALIQATDGKIYGLNTYGGANNFGTMFQFDPATNVFIKKVDFDGLNNGSFPFGSLYEASNGKLYGLTNFGGTNNGGVLFQYDCPTSTLTKKYDFAPISGTNPYSSVIQATNGKLYGTTCYGGYSGGTGNVGVIFSYDIISNIYSVAFTFTSSSTGHNPKGSLVQASNGMLYGLTDNSGFANAGTLFQYNPNNGVFTQKKDFCCSGINASKPLGKLLQATDGHLYGMTANGGDFGLGTLFHYDITTDSVIQNFYFGESKSGRTPLGSMMQASDGMFYGMTRYGGNDNSGTLFQYDPISHSYSKKIDFDIYTNGASPFGSLLQATDGKLYGLTSQGGVNNMGVLFQYDYTTNTITTKFNFDGITNGRLPFGNLIQATNGKIYGMTSQGGINNDGVIFEYDLITNVYSKKFEFNSWDSGNWPGGSLVQAYNGKLYGVTVNGGTFGDGVLFQYDINTNTYTKKIDFNSTLNGSLMGFNSLGNLMQASDGNLFSVTPYGGTNNLGALFQYNISTNTITKKVDFNGFVNGSKPYGNLKQALNGNLYGMTSEGGVNNMGVMFEYNPISNVYTKKIDFNGINGETPFYSGLIETGLFIQTQGVNTTYCAGDSVTVPYTIAGSYMPNNVFSVQLSDALGAFSTPLVIGTTISSSPGIINAVIPSPVPSGSNYRVRVISSSPSIIGNDNGASITINNKPIVTVNSGSICVGNSFTINPSGANTYTFVNGNPIVTPTVTTNYTVIGTNNFGCISTSVTSSVTVNPLPVISVNSGSICSGGSFTLTPSGAFSYTYSSGSVVTPTVTSFYVVIGESAEGCLSQSGASSMVIVNPLPNVVAVSSSSLLCVNETATLTATGAINYNWSTGSNSSTILINPTINSTYYVTGGNSFGCMKSDTITQLIDPCVGVEELTLNNIFVNVFPNPMNDFININFENLILNSELKIFNMYGSLLITQSLNSLNNLIDLSALSNGVYFFKIIDENDLTLSKYIIKQ